MMLSKSKTSLYPLSRVRVVTRRTTRHLSSITNNGLLETLRQRNENDIKALPEYKARSTLDNFLRFKAGLHDASSPPTKDIVPPSPPSGGYKHTLTQSQILTSLDAAMATFHLHVESRIASLCGQGFYTIGPCGEEMLSSVGFAFDPRVDALALHYRHLSVSIVRQLRLNKELEEICLDRARGYCVSRLDPGEYFNIWLTFAISLHMLMFY